VVAVSDATKTDALRNAYLDLLGRAIRNDIYRTEPAPPTKADLAMAKARMAWMSARLAAQGSTETAKQLLGLHPRMFLSVVQGNRPNAHTVLSADALTNVRTCVESVIADGIPGHLIETGVYRGGTTIFMRGILRAWDVGDRNVYASDSFEGLPEPDPDDLDDVLAHAVLDEIDRFAVDVDAVTENFRRYDLLDDQVVFVKGFFADTLPTLAVDRFAVIRLDGDYFDSTWDALANLYPKLSVGGYAIIDDYGAPVACKRAVDKYRDEHGITDEIVEVDGQVVYWRKT
jgi:hypothetical protein